MAQLMKGAEVTAVLNEKLQQQVVALQAKGVTPTLAIVRVGERESDMSYEKGAMKRCATIGVAVKNVLLPAEVTQDELLAEIDRINKDDSIHGCLIFRPLPPQISDDAVRAALSPAKDVDGITDISLGGVFTGNNSGFAPCTAQACMEILAHYNVDLKGKNVCVIGHSLVVGRPVALMALCQDATINICHIFTKDTPAYSRMADIVIVAVGKAGLVDKKYLAPGQIVIDVGINVNAEGKLCGDVKFDEAEPIVAAITPVPGGVGAVTTSVLAKHVIEAAQRTVK